MTVLKLSLINFPNLHMLSLCLHNAKHNGNILYECQLDGILSAVLQSAKGLSE